MYCVSHSSSAISLLGVSPARRTCEEVKARRDGVGEAGGLSVPFRWVGVFFRGGAGGREVIKDSPLSWTGGDTRDSEEEVRENVCQRPLEAIP